MRAVKIFKKAIVKVTKKFSNDFIFDIRYLDPDFVIYKYSKEKIGLYIEDLIIISKPKQNVINNIEKRYKKMYQLDHKENDFLKCLLNLGHISWNRENDEEMISIYLKDDPGINNYLLEQLEAVSPNKNLEDNSYYRLAKKMGLEYINQIEMINLFSNERTEVNNKEIKIEIVENIFKTEFEELMKEPLLLNIERYLMDERENKVEKKRKLYNFFRKTKMS